MTHSPDAISISRFALLQSTSFLFTLTSTPKLFQMALQISEADYQWYQKFHKFFKAEYCICNQGDINAGKESSQ